eukprot:scaffold922_cov327-Pinguiococcus_pyrenoidosus.AAC.45
MSPRIGGSASSRWNPARLHNFPSPCPPRPPHTCSKLPLPTLLQSLQGPLQPRGAPSDAPLYSRASESRLAQKTPPVLGPARRPPRGGRAHSYPAGLSTESPPRSPPSWRGSSARTSPGTSGKATPPRPRRYGRFPPCSSHLPVAGPDPRTDIPPTPSVRP